MTSIPKDPRVSELRELFRNLEAFRTLYESDGIDVLSDEGRIWTLWDLEYLYKATELLTIRQRQAITIYLVHNVREKDAARMMGVSETNPVAMYATLGLKRLLDLMDSGALDRYCEKPGVEHKPRVTHQAYVKKLASVIKRNIVVRSGQCWSYPCREGQRPAVLVRTADGHISISPANILYEVYVEPVSKGFELFHDPKRVSEYANCCVNPWHQTYRLSEAEKRRLRMKVVRRSADIRRRSDQVRALGVTA